MKNKKGFTLVELLAVISILGVIMIFTIPSFLNAFNKSKDTLNSYTDEDLIEAAKTYLTDIDLKVKTYTYNEDSSWPATNSTIRDALGYSGTTYTKGMEMNSYDFKLYLNDKSGIDISIKDLVDQGYYDDGCDYDDSVKVKDCNIKETCLLHGTINTEANELGYLITSGYTAEIVSGCDKN